MRDRTGDEAEQNGEPGRVAAPYHDPRCRSGWLGEDLDGRPIPCLRCRPHLASTAVVNDCSVR